jgi:hypothetical protein
VRPVHERVDVGTRTRDCRLQEVARDLAGADRGDRPDKDQPARRQDGEQDADPEPDRAVGAGVGQRFEDRVEDPRPMCHLPPLEIPVPAEQAVTPEPARSRWN